jgi:hypothetical protein
MAATEQADHDFIDDLLLANNDFAKFVENLLTSFVKPTRIGFAQRVFTGRCSAVGRFG